MTYQSINSLDGTNLRTFANNFVKPRGSEVATAATRDEVGRKKSFMEQSDNVAQCDSVYTSPWHGSPNKDTYPGWNRYDF
jgi:hypothetical protein